MPFVTTLSISELTDVKQWLAEEETAHGHSFICNWQIIEDAFQKRRLWGYVQSGKTSGIIAWSCYSDRSIWDIAVVAHALRGQGIGSVMVRDGIEEARKRGYQRIELECIPSESESFWRAMGFQDVPNPKSLWRPATHLQMTLE